MKLHRNTNRYRRSNAPPTARSPRSYASISSFSAVITLAADWPQAPGQTRTRSYVPSCLRGLRQAARPADTYLLQSRAHLFNFLDFFALPASANSKFGLGGELCIEVTRGTVTTPIKVRGTRAGAHALVTVTVP
ncbi:hypothetical protein DFH09DRAFT_1310186 [Mycena vulgaris]|nr:hypothetical protein DFH09DRAFT_1310186 [Mycena vulgaris]